MVETASGLFELIKDDKNSFVVADFDKRYVEYLGKYEFLVGDYSQGLLRLKGFQKRMPNIFQITSMNFVPLISNITF